MAEKIHGRIQSPKNENGERKDIMILTTADDVIVEEKDEGKNLMLSEKLQQMSPQLNETKPSFSCIWFRPAEHLSE